MSVKYDWLGLMHIAIVTAGGAGMFCGSCMHDNTWARALQNAGAEISLIPTYTPIRVDEKTVSTERIFFGGLNVYLDYRYSFWRKIPRFLTRWLDAPGASAPLVAAPLEPNQDATQQEREQQLQAAEQLWDRYE